MLTGVVPIRWKQLLALLGVLLAVVVGVVFARAAMMAKQHRPLQAVADIGTVQPEQAADNLAGALRFATISATAEEHVTQQAFSGLLEYIADRFPQVHEQAELERVGSFGLLYRLQGRDPELRPMLLAGHTDVVPVEPGTEAQWTHPPFEGSIAEGFIWGRGALDDKVAVLGILEAAERLLNSGFRPERTIYFAFGHDEELGGKTGAKAIAGLLQQRGEKLWMVLDEGGVVVEDTIPGVDEPVALVGIAEKGYVSFEFLAEGQGGHSSMPPPQTSIGIISDALRRLEQNPMPADLRGPTQAMMTTLAPEMPLGTRLALANLWLFEPAVEAFLAREPATDATIRTTTAVTIFEAGTKDNVLPSKARAVVNFRILPGDTVDSVHTHVREVTDDPRIDLRVLEGARNPSRPSRTDSEAYAKLQETIEQAFPGIVVSPYLLVGGTDARHYEPLSRSVYRFLPIRFRGPDRARIHGTNERIGINAYADAVEFYMRLMKQAAG